MSALPPRERDVVVHEVRVACERADAPALHTLLSPDAVALVDTGGDLLAPTRPLTGPVEVAAAMLTTLAGADLTEQHVNGAPALVARRRGRVVAIVSLGIDAGRVARVWITLSPLKLQRWNG